METDSSTPAEREPRRGLRFSLWTKVVLVALLFVGVWFGTRLLGHLFKGTHEREWQEARSDAVYPAPLQDLSGNTAFVYEPVNSIIVMTEPRPSVEVSPVQNDDQGRPSIAWGIPPNVIRLPFIENVLLVRLPDGREGRFQIGAGSASRFAKKFLAPQAGAENSMLQEAIDMIDDSVERSKVEAFLGTFRGRGVQSSTDRQGNGAR